MNAKCRKIFICLYILINILFLCENETITYDRRISVRTKIIIKTRVFDLNHYINRNLSEKKPTLSGKVHSGR